MVVTRRCRTIGEDLVTSQSSAHGESEREPLQLESRSANDENGRRDVYASDVLRCQWARRLSGMGSHLRAARMWVVFDGGVFDSSERMTRYALYSQQGCSGEGVTVFGVSKMLTRALVPASS
jgi:hypothetical protein